ncbi:MAG: class I SAM-dependent methyltransferase [Actinophytocola sp.]|uniref:class I SAM-dependent methyltransferase n=1 Tax=Actinophytocola sp. TaxID=1872138 RepID=UPI003D6BEFE4
MIPDRIRWAVDVVDPRADERLLEIGCGPGVAAALVCERLTTGRLTAVDRSPVAVERTRRRNAAHLGSGRLEVVQSELDTLAVDDFDKAFSVDVNVFWTTDAARELAVLHGALRPGGRLYVLYGGGPTGEDRVTRTIADSLAGHGFVEVERIGSPHGMGVVARR